MTDTMPTIQHPLHPDDLAPMATLRAATAAVKGQIGPESRAMFDEIMGHTPAAPKVTIEAATVGGVPGLWCRPADPIKGAAIVYLHGGGYVVGSARAYSNFVGQIAARAHAPAFVADYRLAPEHAFPAAIDDAVAVYAGVAALGYTSIALAGDSAGGGLALALLALASQRPGVRPSAAAVMSPWTDLAQTGASHATRADADPLLTTDMLARDGALYLAGHDARDPRASPLYGQLAGLPPVRIHVGGDEILLDDSLQYGERFRAAGGDCVVHTWTGMPHVFPANLGVLVAAEAALADLGAFLQASLRA